MEIEFAFLADAAQESGGKLYILGAGIDHITARSFPMVHQALTLVLKLKLHPTEANRQHQLEVQLWDSDGTRMAAFGSPFAVAPRQAGKDCFFQAVINFQGLEFPRPGDYAYHIIVNGEHKKAMPLTLVRLEAAEPGSPGSEKGTDPHPG